MTSKRTLTFEVVLLITLYTVECIPSCRDLDNSQEEVLCTAGKTDYVLTRGLISDSNITTGVTLRECRIIEVELESFHDMINLNYIDLSQNSIKELKLGVFDGANNVNYLNLSDNMLTNLPRGFFEQKSKIAVLDLSKNAINSLELGIFDPLIHLRYLDLSDNKLTGDRLNRYMFDQNPHVQYLFFAKNNMNDAPDTLLDALTMTMSLNLDRCQLNKVPNFATRRNLATMKNLILSSNFISELNKSTFQNLYSLKILNLEYNNIQSIDNEALKNLKSLKVVILKNNKLTSLPDSLFLDSRRINVINLENNLLETVSTKLFRGTELKTLNLSHNKLTYLEHNFCLKLRNSGSGLTKLSFNNNPWQCACLRDILKEVKSLDIRYNSNDFNGRTPVCVTDAEFVCKRDNKLNNHFIEMYVRAKTGI